MKIRLDIKINIDTGLQINADDFRVNFFTGILPESSDGFVIRNEIIEEMIMQVQKGVENMLDLKLAKQIIKEQKEFQRNQSLEWGHLNLNYNILSVLEIKAKFNQYQISDLPESLFSYKRDVPNINRNLDFVPTNFATWISSMYPVVLWSGHNYIPDFWNIKYLSGFETVPKDIYNFIGKKVLDNMYNTHGNLLYPAGVTSSSKSIDGLSQSTSLQRSIYQSNHQWIKGWIEKEEPRLKGIYLGTVCIKI